MFDLHANSNFILHIISYTIFNTDYLRWKTHVPSTKR